MRFRKLKVPTSVQWEVTPNCNYKCLHCYNYWRRSEVFSEHINYDIVTNQLIENHIFKVTITGGEPLLVFEKIKPYLKEMVEAGIKISINTNAALLTQKMVEFFKDNNICLLISLPCCVPEINDKITNIKDSFGLTVEGIKLARKNQLNFSVNMVVSKLNKDYIIDTAIFLHDELGVNEINVTKASKPIKGFNEFDDYALSLKDLKKMFKDLIFVKEEYSMYVDSLTAYPECVCDSYDIFNIFARRKCFAGKTSVAIGYNGDVKACERDNVSYGNLKNKTLQECWDAMDDWRIINDEGLPEECNECNSKYSCQGGCRIDLKNEIPNKCYRDSSNVPVEFDFKTKKCFDLALIDTFEVIGDLLFYEEEFGIKGVNENKEEFFITRALYSYMMKHKRFSKKELMKYFDISYEESDDVLSYLINNNAIEML